MQIKNNYQLEWEITTRYGMTIDKGIGVFNGDMGIIKKINTYEETVTVEYDEKKQVKYPYNLLDELELAYAITTIKRREANILQSLSLCYRDQDSFIIEICSIQLSQERENV